MRSPTPKASICAPCSSRVSISFSSSELETVILHSGQPASSSITRAFFVRYAMSPESKRMPHFVMPLGFNTSLKARIAFGTPDCREL